MKREVTIDFEKGGGLVPAVVQDSRSGTVLMLGYMNAEALERTRREGTVTFFSRSKNRLWTKGEESGNFLDVVAIHVDCDADTVLIVAQPRGATCHTGSQSCFGDGALRSASFPFLASLGSLINGRRTAPTEGSYTSSLFSQGIERIAQKVGEEGVEVAIEAVRNRSREKLVSEAADLVYHLMVLLEASESGLADVEAELRGRHEAELRKRHEA